MTDVADVLADSTMDSVASQAPVVNEVAIAAADSFLPVQALQYVIDAVHFYTGLNWWVSLSICVCVRVRVCVCVCEMMNPKCIPK